MSKFKENITSVVLPLETEHVSEILMSLIEYWYNKGFADATEVKEDE